MRETQAIKVLRIWVEKQAREPEKFFYPYEFISHGNVFIGYKAPARFSELCVAYPDMIQSHLMGKYRVGRIRLDNSAEFLSLSSIPFQIRAVMREEIRRHVGSVKVKKIVPVYNRETNSVKLTEVIEEE